MAFDCFTPLSPRVAALREAAREREQHRPPSWKRPHFEEAFFGRYAHRPYWERYARALAFALENEPVYLFPEEHLVGMLYQATGLPPDFTPDDSRTAVYDPYHFARPRLAAEFDPYVAGLGSPGHVGWRWDRLLEEGVDGLLARLRAHLANAPDARAKRLYRGAIFLWEAVLRWNDRHLQALCLAQDAATGTDRERLERLVALCERVPRYSARTFHEAVQSFYLQYLAVMFENPYGGNGPGRMDVYLWPYLQADLEAGRTTLGEAKDLVDELFLRLHERIAPADGWVEAVTVGGVHADGSDAANPLTYLMIESIGALDQTHPSVYVRLSQENPEDLLDLSARYLVHGRNRAQIYNDEACLEAIVASGTPYADAARYMAGGCMEISVQGANCDLNWTRTHNVAKTLELVLTGGEDLVTGERPLRLDRDLTGYASFEEFYAAFDGQLAWEYGQIARSLDVVSECFARYRPTYLLSSLTDDCLERGREQQEGGARYHEYGFAPLALTSAADSLAALRRAVYEEGFVEPEELLAALRADFEGYAALRARLLQLPRYGWQDPEADGLCNRVLASVCRASREARTRFGGHLKPMFFNFVWTPEASAALGARADGSRAGEPIGHGLTPTRRGLAAGLTSALNSCLSLDLTGVSGGATTMWDMDHDWITEERMRAILRVFLAGGGMIFQGNTTSVEELEQALDDPAAYPHLFVRVGGFSARFTTLSRDLQEEIVTRHRHRS